MATDYPIHLFHPDLPGVSIVSHTASSHRVHAKSGWVEDLPEVDLSSMTRHELDEFARSIGIHHPDALPNKQAVLDAINDHDPN